ncbi:MAG: nitroreductase [Burkholderiales bacterium]|nr:nitroreductase [Burkholderiales bacterium]
MNPPPDTTVPPDAASVDAAITSRRSMRAFLPTPVARETIAEVLAVAARAPSGSNTQPWRVYVVEGVARGRIEREVCAAHDALRADPALAEVYRESYDYYPSTWFEPYLQRRRDNGWGLYGLLGITRADKDAMHAQHQRNFRFFDAPVGLFFSIHRSLGRGSLLDCGMFVQSVMVAARARGLHSCPQAAWNGFASIIAPILGMGDDELLVCGLSLGYADETASVNAFQTPRLAVEDFTRWIA